jgi:spore maturation protein B
MKYLEVVASLAVPLIMLSAGILMAIGKKDYFSVFLNGAEEGLRTAVGLLPTLVILLTAVHMLRASGLTELLSKVLSTPAEKIGVPSEIVPLLLTRPFSGSASTAMFSSLLEDVGADGFPAMCAAVIMGSSDTAVYIISVYFSSVKIKNTGYALPLAFVVMIFCVFFSCFISNMCFK